MTKKKLATNTVIDYTPLFNNNDCAWEFIGNIYVSDVSSDYSDAFINHLNTCNIRQKESLEDECFIQ